jgi:type 1 glutamine amidotransferase
MRVLVLCDDFWHPARNVRTGLGPLENRGLKFDWVEKADDRAIQRMQTYPVVVLAKWNHVSSTDKRPWITEEVRSAFMDHVCKGHGLLFIHSGMAGCRGLPQWRALLGGEFVSHPAQCPVTVEPHQGHALSAASAPFTLPDEHYFVELDDEKSDIFLTTVSEHGTQPGGWTRSVGAGRVCVLTPGHGCEVWLQPSYQSVIYNALRWCGDMK